MTYDAERRLVQARPGERWRKLSRTQSALFGRLYKESGRPVADNALIAAGWGVEMPRVALQVAIMRLREKLPPDSILTVRGYGYLLNPEVL